MTKKCPLCGHYYGSQERLSAHLSKDHGAGLDRWGA